MSRSKHVTRARIQREIRWRYSRDRTSQVDELQAEYRAKRRLKKRRRCFKYPGERADKVLVLERESSQPHVHFPLSARELEEFLELLPDWCQGLEAIELCLGRLDQRGFADESAEPDPILERLGSEFLAGVFAGQALGAYFFSRSLIRLYAFVYKQEELPQREIKELLLKLSFLSTLVHELAHHRDDTLRSGRRRWAVDSEESAEIYAEGREHYLLREVVLPFLKAKYSSRVRRFEEWTRESTGVRVPLQEFLPDPRKTAKGGFFRWNGSLWSSLDILFEDPEDSTLVSERRYRFAREVHYCDRYELCLRLLDANLQECPDHLQSKILYFDTLDHLGRSAEAKLGIREVIEAAPDQSEAWSVLAQAAESLGDWMAVAEAHAEIERINGKLTLYELHSYARAHLELDQVPNFWECLRRMRNARSPFGRWKAAGLEAVYYLRTGQLVEAAKVVEEGLWDDTKSVWRNILLGVHYQLNKHNPDPPELTPRTRELLEHWGFQELTN